MWFKQLQLFQLTDTKHYLSTNQNTDLKEKLHQKLNQYAYQECLPSLPFTAGWISPVDEEGAPFVFAMNGYMMICLQVEEKILPPMVIRQELLKKIKQIETMEGRKVGAKEKYTLKDEMIMTLMPRAFSKLTKVYGYLDTKNQRLMLGTCNSKKTEQFISLFKKTFGESIDVLDLPKLSMLMTTWITNENYPSTFSIEKSCVLRDINHDTRVIRCKEQDLFADNIKSFIKEGCEVIQLALNWQDRVNFVLLDNLSFQSISFDDEIIAEIKEMEAGTKQQQFGADFFMMTQTFENLLNDLYQAIKETHNNLKLTVADQAENAAA